MGGGPKTPNGAVLDPGERLDLLLGHLGACRAGLSEKEAAPTSLGPSEETRTSGATERR